MFDHRLTTLRKVLGPEIILDTDVASQYVTDWTGRFVGSPICVARPRNVVEVVRVMEAAARLEVPVVPQGGNTGLVGATMAPAGSILVNLGELDGIEPGEEPGTLIVGAGVTIGELQAEAKRRGLVFGVDMASRDSATVGGAISTNAGGLRVCRYGRMGDQVVEVEAVMADGTMIALPDDQGRDTEILVGSEGTLGVITGAMVRLHGPAPPSRVLLAGFDELSEAYRAASSIGSPLAAEFFGNPEMDTVVDATGLVRPFEDGDDAWFLLLEVESAALNRLSLPDSTLVGDDLWAYRDRITDSVSRLGVVHKFDVVVPAHLVGGLADELRSRLSPLRVFVFGHLLVHGIHINVAPASPGDVVGEGVDDIVYDAVERVRGVVAGEHGVGRVKADRARAALTEEQRRLFDDQKRTLDPEGRLNPGVGRRFH